MANLKTFNSFTGEWEDVAEEITIPSDIIISDSTKGVVLNSATKQWRLTVDDSGTLVITEITPV